MKLKIKLKHIINASIIAWLVIYLYYLIFNWEIFSINLKTNLGFTVIASYPFVFFFIIGLFFLILIRYYDHSVEIRKLSRDKDMENKISLLEKDIELLRLKETLFKMQSEEMSRNNATLNALHKRLDEISSSLEDEKKTDDSDDTTKGTANDTNPKA
ncbi:MAG: hypothetical protein KFF49_12520 [Bacteroidales bacterium]|nr:hypothetical protein [Bacteroidales bacterium]